jgi:hypothetical protein
MDGDSDRARRRLARGVLSSSPTWRCCASRAMPSASGRPEPTP